MVESKLDVPLLRTEGCRCGVLSQWRGTEFVSGGATYLGGSQEGQSTARAVWMRIKEREKRVIFVGA